jgi:hypothetical protein
VLCGTASDECSHGIKTTVNVDIQQKSALRTWNVWGRCYRCPCRLQLQSSSFMLHAWYHVMLQLQALVLRSADPHICQCWNYSSIFIPYEPANQPILFSLHGNCNSCQVFRYKLKTERACTQSSKGKDAQWQHQITQGAKKDQLRGECHGLIPTGRFPSWKCKLNSSDHKNVVTCCHKSGYQTDLQCFPRFLLAILKQLSFCSVEQLTRLRNLKKITNLYVIIKHKTLPPME